MGKGALIRETPGMRVYQSDASPDRFAVEFTNDAVECGPEMSPMFPGKGALNMKIAAALFKRLEDCGVATHFARETGESEMETIAARIIPARVAVRNMVSEEFAARTRLAAGSILPVTIIEFNVKMDAVKEFQPGMRARVYTEVTDGDVKTMRTRAAQVNKALRSFLYSRGIALADYYLEFGKDSNDFFRVCGALTPDTCSFWSRDTLEKLDKDRYLRPMRGSETAAGSVLKSLTA